MSKSLQERLKALYPAGYRYCIEFDPASNIEPLAVKSPGHVGPMIRKYFPNEKNYRGWEFDSEGNEVTK